MTNKVLNICSPGIGFDPDNEQYVHCEDFRDAVHKLLYEAELYVTENKCSEIQKEFEFKEGEDPLIKQMERTKKRMEKVNTLLLNTKNLY
ncbi:hypothetical protein ACIXWW_02910 [Bacteroides fragilis]